MMMLGLLVVGTNHRTAPVELREALAFDPDQVRRALEVVKGEQVLEEMMILSTCNRTEIYSLAPDLRKAEGYVRDLVTRIKGTDLLKAGPQSYVHRERDMAAHLFRVSASLDSMMLGEMQILGQVKEAYNLACEGGSAGVVLNRLLNTAMRVGKRARTETRIGAGAVSVASAAVTLTTKIMSDLSHKRVLLVGAGETGRLAAKHYSDLPLGGLMIANRTKARAEEVARELGGEAHSLEELPQALPRADIVVCATSSPDTLITAGMVEAAMRERRDRPMVLVDISVPRDVDPAVARIENVFSYPIDALQNLVDQNLSRRRKEVPKVEAIVDEELERFFRWTRSLKVAPVIKALRDQFEDVRAGEVDKHLRHFSADQHERIHALTRAIVNKLLHSPTVTIKQLSPDTDDGVAKLDAACELFKLQPETGEASNNGAGKGKPQDVAEADSTERTEVENL